MREPARMSAFQIGHTNRIRHPAYRLSRNALSQAAASGNEPCVLRHQSPRFWHRFQTSLSSILLLRCHRLCTSRSSGDYLNLSSQDESNEDCSISAVNLMTCHKSKGLEFPVVFIPGVQVGIFPNDFFINTNEELEAERRLFYVSMTRAINELYITCYSDPFRGSGIIKKGFIAEIPNIRFQEV